MVKGVPVRKTRGSSDPVVSPGSEYGQDVGMLHPGRQPKLLLEPFHAFPVCQYMRAHDLDRDRATAKLLVERQPHLAHTALTEQPDLSVTPAEYSHPTSHPSAPLQEA